MEDIVNATVVVGDIINATVDNTSETVTVTLTTEQEVLNATIVPGAIGPQGDKGDKGDTGATGLQGIQGVKGDTGVKGDKGDKGDTGATGQNGTNGTNGAAATIAVGTVTTGAAGSSVSVINSGTSAAAIFDIAIPKGDTGASGSGTGDMLSTNNLSDLTNATTARTNLGLGTLATQSGTFSGTSSGTNSGDETQATIKTKLGAATASVDGYATATQITKLNGIEAAADVTDTTNVTAAGALMDGDFSSNGLMQRTGPGIYSVKGVPTGDVVGTTDTQTLTNKTIVVASNTITGLTNANLSTTAGELGGAWASWTPTITGFSANPTGAVYKYSKVGKTVHLAIRQLTAGTSNADSFTISLPFTAKTETNMYWSGFGAGNDNSVTLTTPIWGHIQSGDTVLKLFQNFNSAVWTTSGGKSARIFAITYEAA